AVDIAGYLNRGDCADQRRVGGDDRSACLMVGRVEPDPGGGDGGHTHLLQGPAQPVSQGLAGGAIPDVDGRLNQGGAFLFGPFGTRGQVRVGGDRRGAAAADEQQAGDRATGYSRAQEASQGRGGGEAAVFAA